MEIFGGAAALGGLNYALLVKGVLERIRRCFYMTDEIICPERGKRFVLVDGWHDYKQVLLLGELEY